jgi:RimJ/RimL family protein N-acetyltransferase
MERLILETIRLRLRLLTLSDTAFIIELLNSPGWLKFIGDRNVRTEAQAVAYLENGPLASYQRNGYGLFLVERKVDSQRIGMCGILKREELETPDIGFALLPQFHGVGYAAEIADATLSYAREKLGLPTIAAIVQPDNERSIALLKKNGFSFEKMFSFNGKEELLELYQKVSSPIS